MAPRLERKRACTDSYRDGGHRLLRQPFRVPVTLPKMLQSAGYATAHFGKWHLSNDMIPDSPLPKVYGYDEYGAFNCAGEQMPVHEDADHAIAFIEKSVAASPNSKRGKPICRISRLEKFFPKSASNDRNLQQESRLGYLPCRLINGLKIMDLNILSSLGRNFRVRR